MGETPFSNSTAQTPLFPSPPCTRHNTPCILLSATWNFPRQAKDWSIMNEGVAGEPERTCEVASIQVLCRPQCTTDLSNMFQKCQPRAIPELAHAVVPLTCSLAVYLCNSLSLSPLTAEMLLMLPLFVFCFLNKQVLLPYKTNGIFQLNEHLQFARHKHPSNLSSLFAPFLLNGESKEDAACTILITSNLNLATISGTSFFLLLCLSY